MSDKTDINNYQKYLSNKNNTYNEDGILPSIWGPPMWKSLHLISFGYPKNPSNDDKNHYKSFFQLLAYILPCKACRESYYYFINHGDTILNDDVFKNRDTLTFWLYNLHNAVNKKLNVSYNITYPDVVKMYESFRATCQNNKCVKNNNSNQQTTELNNNPINNNNSINNNNNYSTNDDNNNYITLTYDIAKIFSHYAQIRGINDFNDILTNTNKQNQASEIINYMKKNNIPSIEKDGMFINLPTKLELQLIARLGTNLTIDKLNHVILLINKNYNPHININDINDIDNKNKKYKFS